MAMPKTALDDVRVLDLGRYQAGPRIGLVLARMGAEVIKVEAPGGDESRAMGPRVRGQSAYWVQYNSGKKEPRSQYAHGQGQRDYLRVGEGVGRRHSKFPPRHHRPPWAWATSGCGS